MAEQTDFAIVPTQKQLDEIDRELGFFPANHGVPKTLSAGQVQTYNRTGYLKPIPVFSESEVVGVRREFDRLLEEYAKAGGDSYSISSAHLKHAVAYDILTDPRLTALVRDLLGPNVVGWGSHFFCKMPHDGKRVAWHQDATYWPITPTKTCTVWLAVDDASTENACMRFISGSHLNGMIEYEESAASEGNVLNQTVKDVERFGEPVDVELKAGEISIHSDLLLHGSEANESESRRCGLTLRYCAADVRAHLDWNRKGVLVAGEDPDKHWANPGRPAVG